MLQRAASRLVLRSGSNISPSISSRLFATGCGGRTVVHGKTVPPRTPPPKEAPPTSTTQMFCFQCEQTRNNTGCTDIGVCGKTADVAALQDLLIHACKGISMYAHRARQMGAKDSEIDRFMLRALFSTLTNVNFDPVRFRGYLQEAQQLLEKAKGLYLTACKAQGKQPEKLGGPTKFTFSGFDIPELVAAGRSVGVLQRKQDYDPNVFGLVELTVYGLKGMCAYAEHALVLGEEKDSVYEFIHMALDRLTDPKLTLDGALQLVLGVGKTNLDVMGLLDQGNNERFGVMSPTKCRITPVTGKCILVSGHDLQDLETILKQTEGQGINVYTHGEMLPAHGYPKLRAFKHLVGNYGNAWQLQRSEFSEFPGPIVMTTNCLIEPLKSYKGRLFTRSVVGWPNVTHIDNEDYSQVIQAAKDAEGFLPEDLEDVKERFVTVGFGHRSVLANADKIVELIKSGKLQKVFVIGGCDGSETSRSYFRDMAMNVPKNGIILTMGCGKFRFNKEDFGDIEGIPRLLDVGQCNDSFGAIQIAVQLAQALGISNVNELPLSFGVSWFEQKAIAVFCTMLYLNIQNIHLGPSLPAFLTPDLIDYLVKNFKVAPTVNGTADAQKLAARQNNL